MFASLQKFSAALLVMLLFAGACVAPGLEPAQNQLPVATAAPTEMTSPETSSQVISDQLRQAVESSDFGTMRSLMDDNLFVIAFWPGNSLPPLPADDALAQLRNLHMTGGPIRFPEPDVPLSEMLDNQDPFHVFQSDVQVVDVLFSQGWGPEGLGEAMLFVAQRPDGSFWWYSIIIAPTGFPRLM
ncbi:MAG: hypothetical protein KF753_11330 [Caldilineaceae bacterium]|nr:hypothetical protein [Caldilineaceae bacterium]